MIQVVETNVLLLFTETMAIPLEANFTEEEEDAEMDDRALQALMEGARSQPSAPAPAPAPAPAQTYTYTSSPLCWQSQGKRKEEGR